MNKKLSDIEEKVNFLEFTVKTDTTKAAYKKMFPIQNYDNIDELLTHVKQWIIEEKSLKVS